ncbi:MAG: nucleotidyltransferase domain-containing protein [Terrisporobacter sp.]|uniref:nucleotidyltransferase domain-containing protein n=1 Tax=Terrisporobacter sp. TaxID=1965305 RepID=UPI002FC81606
MKKIPKKISSLIMDTLPKDITDAIYIFGSYTTEYFDEENSDIDIAWFTNKPVEYSSLASYEVDLVIPDKSNIYFLVEVLSNPPIYIGNDEFTDWLDRFNDWVLDEYKFIENVISERCDLFE